MATESITTVARPYAKALFELALQDKKLDAWSSMLHLMSTVALHDEVKELVGTPGLSAEKIACLFIDICGKHLDDSGQNLIRVLAENGRLLALPEILGIYEMLKAEQEKTLEVDVKAFEALDKTQEAELIKALKERLAREIHLNVTIDKSLLGGAVIHAGSLVIDGSVKTKLNQLNIGLQEA